MIRWRYNNGKLNHDSYNAGEIAYRHRIFSSNYYEKPQKKKKTQCTCFAIFHGKSPKNTCTKWLCTDFPHIYN